MATSKAPPTLEAHRPYGRGDNSFQTAGGVDGVGALVDDFYDAMAHQDFARRILGMHTEGLPVARDKLARFLCGWLGGPRRFHEKYGPISIPRAHHHLDIGIADRDAWIQCMSIAVARQPYPEDFQRYLLEQLMVPAERCRTRE